MRLNQLDYDLPEVLIAQEPLPARDQARMLVLDRRTGHVEHARFYKLTRYLREGDLLVLNDTRVLPARLITRKETGGIVELLMVREAEAPAGAWIAMARTHRPLREGTRLMLDSGDALTIVGYERPGRPLVASAEGIAISTLIHQAGIVALPHYIGRPANDADATDYQTVFARHPGAIAAPTAGRHFTEELFRDLADAGVLTAFLTLHIGPGTFSPMRDAEVEGHSMEAERYLIPPAALGALDHAHRVGGRVIAVGTSSIRALESWAITGDVEGFTGLFIHPGFRFKVVDAIITNFHMPRSTVLALAMAFAGRDHLMRAYAEAIRHRYRFLSYGDAMLVV